MSWLLPRAVASEPVSLPRWEGSSSAESGQAGKRQAVLIGLLASLLGGISPLAAAPTMLAGALSLFAPATAEARTTLWSGTLTVGTNGSGSEVGCGSQVSACSGRLTTDTVTLEGKAYRITQIVVRTWASPPDLKLKLTRKFPDAVTLDNPHGRIWSKLTLQVGGKSFDAPNSFNLNEISPSQSALQWNNPGLSWTSGQQVQARLFYNDDPPSVPRNVRAIAIDNQVILNWDAPSSWGDGTAGGFRIEWKPTSEPPEKWTPVNSANREYEVGASVSSFVLSGTQMLEGRDDRFIGHHPTHPNPTRAQALDLRIRAFSANPKVTGDWVEVTAERGAKVTLSASPTTVWEGQASRVTATLSNPLSRGVLIPVTVTPCPEGSWCKRFNGYPIHIPAGRTVGNLRGPVDPAATVMTKVVVDGTHNEDDRFIGTQTNLYAGPQTSLLTVRDADAEDEEVTVALGSLPRNVIAGSTTSQKIKVLDLDNDRIRLRSGKTELMEGEEVEVTLDLGLPATRGTDESRFLVTVEGMGTGDNPAKPSRSVTNPAANGGDFSLWAEGTTKILEKGKSVTYQQALTGTPKTIFVDTKTYPGRARPRVSEGKLMLAVPFNKGDQTKALKLKIGADAVVEADETFKLKVAVQFGNGNEKTAELDFTISDDDRKRDVPEYKDNGELVDEGQGAKVYVLDPRKIWSLQYSTCRAEIRLVSNAKGGVRLGQAVTIPVSVNGQKRSLTISPGHTANWIDNANKDVTVEVLRDQLPEDGLVSREDPRTALTKVTAAYYGLDGQIIVYNPYEEHDVTRKYAYENGCVASPTVPEGEAAGEEEEGKRKYGPSPTASGPDGETLLVGFGQIAQTPPEVSIELDGDGSSTINEGQMARFRVTADPAPAAPITVAVAIGDRGEFVSSGQPNPRMVTIGEDGTADFSVATQDDEMDEPDGAIIATVTAGTGYTVSDNTAEAEVTVRDNDAPVAAPPTEENRAWHVRFGRTVSQQVVDALQQRFSTTSTTPSGLQLTLAGETVTSDTPLQENHVLLSRLLGFERVSSQELAQGSSFSFSPDGAGPRLSFWGKGAFSSFDGIEESITLTGDVTTALVGAEWSNERWQAGAALSHSWGNGSYQGEGDGADGRISSTLTGIFPYGRYALTPRLGLWATAGYGWGAITLNPDGDGSEYNPNTTMALGAVGMDGLLLDGGSEGVTLTTTADALFLKTTSEAVEGLASSEGNISRLRLGLEATRPFPLANGASLSPSLEVGLRQDSGDAETGFGMDLGAGLSWNDPEQGITATVKGRTLLSHGAEDFQDQGLALSFSWQPSSSNRGPSLSLSHAVGLPAEGGLAALLNPTAIEVLDDSHSDGERFEARLAYGFPFYNDRLTLTPAVTAALSPSSRSYGLLWSLAPYDEHLHAEPWELSLEGERQENLSSSSTVDHSLKLRFALPL